MRNKNLYPILCVALVMLVAALACSSLNATPGASNFFMATDKDGANKTTTFSPTDDFYVFFNVAGIEDGTSFHSRWYALDLEGQDPNTPIQTIDYPYEKGISKVYFQLTNKSDWPVGNYKVEIYIKDTKIGEQTFNVQ